MDIYGFIHKNGKGELVGGVEYLPAKVIPYDIPHDDDIAFLTCVYMTDAAYDYKFEGGVRRSVDFTDCIVEIMQFCMILYKKYMQIYRIIDNIDYISIYGASEEKIWHLERKTLTQLFVPICVETLFYMLSGMVDTLMLSSVVTRLWEFVGTANTYIGVFIIMFGVISSGMVAVMSQNIGAGRPELHIRPDSLD